ncbi:DUF732 domain-containing protein [Mycobacterium sp.]|jgi:hypothetical protein|uniref:DUF732 domain-containing protein n=1 Tax=Mycobacterium sp. TaxID=1785 RepID=UPI003BB0FB97
MRRLLAVLAIASSLGAAIPAHADPNVDASFVDALNKAGITSDDSRSAISAGKTACELMGQGKPQIDVVALVAQQNPAISTTRAAQFTAIAASAYCPQYLHRATDGDGSQAQPPPDRVGVSGGQQ